MNSLSPINDPQYILLDKRDWDAIRARLSNLEDDNQNIRMQITLLMQGVKERFDEHQRLLLARIESPLERKELG